MRVEKTSFYSRHLGFNMPVAVYGHWGVPVLYFPTASADFEELERFGMIGALSDHIESGRIKIFSINSVNDWSLDNESVGPGERIWRQELYDRYIIDEVVPYIFSNCGGPLPIAAVGASFGAYHALNTLFRHHEVFRWCIGMSGIYNISCFLDGYYDERCYFHNPVSYIANLYDPNIRRSLDGCNINVICGQGAWERVHYSREIHEVMDRVGIRHNFELWGYDVAHDWPWWKVQMRQLVPRLFPLG